MKRILVGVCTVALMVAVESSGQSRYEVARGSVSDIGLEAGRIGGLTFDIELPRLDEQRELISAILWLDILPEKRDDVGRDDEKACIAAMGVSGEGALASCATSEIQVSTNKSRTVCMDITALAQQARRTGGERMQIAIVPCSDEGDGTAVSLAEGTSIVGWVEYSYYNRSKAESLLGR